MSKKEKITKANKRKKKLIITSALTAVLIAGSLGIAGITKADEKVGGIWDILTDDQKQQVESMREERQQEQEEFKQAIIDGDYAKWKEVIDSRPKVTDYINEENFAQFSEMHKLMEDEDFEAAEEIREELGLPEKGTGMGMGMKGMMGGQGKGMGRGMHKGMNHDVDAS